MNRIILAVGFTILASGAQAEPVAGKSTLNDEPLGFQHAYVYKEEGFYDPADPTWTVLFAAEEIAPRDVEDPFIDPSLRITLSLTDEFSDEAELNVISQAFYVDGKSMSGGESPQLAITRHGDDGLAGRIFHQEKQEFFDDTFFYDLSFDAGLVDPNMPIGDALPAGGGEPGKAYVEWTRAIHAGDVEALKAMVSQDMAAMLDGPEGQEGIEMMAAFTLTDVTVLGGSSDGSTAILDVKGSMDGMETGGEVTMEKMEGRWIPTDTSYE